MRQAIQQCRRHLRITKDAGPFTEGQVRRDHHASVLIELGQQVEQQGPAGLAERQIAQLVQNHQVHAHQGKGQLPRLAGGFLLFQQIHQIDRRVEPNPLAVLGDAGDAEGRGQMGLAGARATDEHHYKGFPTKVKREDRDGFSLPCS
jgi:hypothetical protein